MTSGGVPRYQSGCEQMGLEEGEGQYFHRRMKQGNSVANNGLEEFKTKAVGR